MTKVKESQPSMSDLLQHVSNDGEITVGSIIQGVVLSITKNEVLLDIENIGLGVVRGKEIFNEEYLTRLAVGETIDALVLDLENERQLIELSFRAIGREKVWQEIQDIFENQITVEAKIRDANKGGYIVRVHGVDGFLPASLLSPTHAVKMGVEDKSLLQQMEKYIGQTFQVKIINVNNEGDTIIVSEKLVSDETAQAKISRYKIGDVIEGVIVGAVDFGVFVRFDDDIEGLTHISELAWKKIDDPRKEYKVNDKVKAKIVDIDKENRINLSFKRLQPNPWIDFVSKTKPGDVFEGTVIKIVTYGAIVINKDDVQGLIHISQITEDGIDNPSEIHDYLKVGETREFTILSAGNDEKLNLTLLPFEKALAIQEALVVKMKEKEIIHEVAEELNHS